VSAAKRIPATDTAGADDGACAHLLGAPIPALVLPSTAGPLDLAALAAARLVLYLYPRTGRPGQPPPPGWELLRGAIGCTAQSCAFRDAHAELAAAGARIVGLSAQPLDEQLEFSARNTIPFPLVSDSELRFADALRLPTFAFAGQTLYKRATLVAERGEIVRVFYPVAAPEVNAAEVLAWLMGRSAIRRR
jgi:peroxiredoxin